MTACEALQATSINTIIKMNLLSKDTSPTIPPGWEAFP